MPNLHQSLIEAMRLPGALGAAAADLETGDVIARAGDWGAEHTLAHVSLRALRELNRRAPTEELLLTLADRCHLLRLTASAPPERPLALFVALDRERGNFALARIRLARIADALDDLSDAASPPAPPTLPPTPAAAPSESGDDATLPPFLRDDSVYRLLGLAAPSSSAAQKPSPMPTRGVQSPAATADARA